MAATLGAMNETRTHEALEIRHALAGLGFRPALLHFDTMTLYWSFDGLAGLSRATLLEGFERGGFFYTREAAVRAAREWT